MIRIDQLRLEPVKNESPIALTARLKKKAAKLLKIREEDIRDLRIVRSSVDARKKPEVFVTCSVEVKVSGEKGILKKVSSPNVKEAKNVIYSPVRGSLEKKKCIVAGAGPAGLFCAYMLALAGLKPLLIERGRDVDRRSADVEAFWKTGVLDPVSNVQFGEGGAGTFSDGKLNTGVKDPFGRIEYVLETFVKLGAPESILYDSHPHVGTDILKSVVKNLRERIEELGGRVCFESALTSVSQKNGVLTGIGINNERFEDADALVLAIGHSAADTFSMLVSSGLSMESKSFAVGYRVMHPQAMINRAQYGERYADYFGAAPYRLAEKTPDGRGVYTFCMCPGGYVVNSSAEEGRLCVNGMSYSGRDGYYANSAVIMSVDERDFERELTKAGIYKAGDPLAGMLYQKLLEERAFKAAGGKIPVSTLNAFLRNGENTPADLDAAVKGAREFCDMKGILPTELEEAFAFGMERFEKRIRGFSTEGFMAGVESRTSSPVRITRSEDGVSNMQGVYPCGEGAGYAGGIVSAAVDGIKIAEKILS